MDLNISDLYRIAIWLFMAGAVLSLVLSRLPKFCLLFANLTALIAAATLALASLGKLCAGGGTPLTLWLIQPTFPLFSIAMKVDDLSAFFLLSLAILTFCVSLFSIGYLGHYIGKRRIGLFHFLYLSFILSMILVFSAADSLFFYLVWEGMSLVSYFLVVFETEKEENQRAGTLYIIMTHLASSCLLIAFLLIYSYTGSFAMSGDTSALPLHIKNITFALLLIGFGTKAGVIPFHIWLPYAHPAAPSNVSALMSGIMIKTAIYGLVRFILG
ncbi:MAG: formate hydrogenlyase, partial [Peptococcaceae bacterium]|nr:formate hydrogenlyase [Peptococcaceae bacterium]